MLGLVVPLERLRPGAQRSAANPLIAPLTRECQRKTRRRPTGLSAILVVGSPVKQSRGRGERRFGWFQLVGPLAGSSILLVGTAEWAEKRRSLF